MVSILKWSSDCLSICLSIPSIDSSSDVQWVCCWVQTWATDINRHLPLSSHFVTATWHAGRTNFSPAAKRSNILVLDSSLGGACHILKWLQKRLVKQKLKVVVLHTHTHTHLFNGPLFGTTQVNRYQKVKPIWILLKQETVSGSGICWAMCKSAPRAREISTPAPHHSVFLQAGCFSCHPNVSVKTLKGSWVKYCSCKKK